MIGKLGSKLQKRCYVWCRAERPSEFGKIIGKLGSKLQKRCHWEYSGAERPREFGKMIGNF